MKWVGFTQRTGRRTLAGTVAAFMVVATGVTIGGLTPAQDAEALDGLELVSINAYWDMTTFEARSAPNGGGTLATVPCLEDGISDLAGGAPGGDPSHRLR